MLARRTAVPRATTLPLCHDDAMNAVAVSRAAAEEWRTAKDVRLRALAADPHAFGSTVAREQGFDDDVWRTRTAAGRTFLARSGDQVVGVVSFHVESDRVHERHLVSMWVAPEVRGAGTGALLVQAAREAAAVEGARALTLFVADGNDRARRFYERLGFRATGERQTLPSDPCLGEERYVLTLPEHGSTLRRVRIKRGPAPADDTVSREQAP